MNRFMSRRNGFGVGRGAVRGGMCVRSSSPLTNNSLDIPLNRRLSSILRRPGVFAGRFCATLVYYRVALEPGASFSILTAAVVALPAHYGTSQRQM
jgi:hypothetical protein